MMKCLLCFIVGGFVGMLVMSMIVIAKQRQWDFPEINNGRERFEKTLKPLLNKERKKAIKKLKEK